MITARFLQRAIHPAALAIAVGTALCTGLAPALAQTPFRVGISDPVNTVLAWWMAENARFLQGAGPRRSRYRHAGR